MIAAITVRHPLSPRPTGVELCLHLYLCVHISDVFSKHSEAAKTFPLIGFPRRGPIGRATADLWHVFNV